MVQFLRKPSLPLILVASMMLGGALTGTALAYQGHMWSAKADLIRAENQLQAATPDKAGHREQALSLVNQAISQVNLGIASGAK